MYIIRFKNDYQETTYPRLILQAPIEKDFPPEIDAKRKVLKPVMIGASKLTDKDGKKPYSASMSINRLFVNGKPYTTSTLHELPDNINPKNLFTPTKGKTTAFFTYNSPLSNHYTANQVVDNKQYNSNEQYYMYSKAMKFNDLSSASKILKETRPGEQKKLGDSRRIKNFKQSVWDDCCIDIMKRGLQAKFGQNPELQNFLLNTGDNMLVEGNPNDGYWGAELSIYDPRIWQHNMWWGKAQNHLGRLLQDTRLELKRNC